MDTKVSSKGQVIIPKSLRDKRGWKAGTELIVEERAEGILLRPKHGLKRTTLDEVVGIAKYKGPPKSLEDMQRGIEAGLRERARRKGFGK